MNSLKITSKAKQLEEILPPLLAPLRFFYFVLHF